MRHTATEEYAARLRAFDKIIETYSNARSTLNIAGLSCSQYGTDARPTNRFLLTEYAVDVDHAIRDAKLDANERSTLVRVFLEQMADIPRVPETLRQPVVNKVGRLFVKRQLEPIHWFRRIKQKIDWRTATGAV